MKTGKIFYGWWVVATCVLVGAMLYGIGLYSFTLFIMPLTEEFGWSRAITGGAVAIFWLASPLSIFTGPLIKRFGIRKLMISGAVIEGVSLCLIAYISLILELYILRVFMGFGKILMAIAMPPLVSYWFNRQFGFAIGIAMAGFQLGGVIAAPITQMLIDNLGWRHTSIVLGVSLLVITTTSILWMLRVERPEEVGLFPDGDSKHDNQIMRDNTLETTIHSSDTRPIFRCLMYMKQFWVVMIGTILFYYCHGSVITHQAVFLTEIGVAAQVAANAVSLTTGMAIAGLLLTGLVIDRWCRQKVQLIVFTTFLISLVCLVLLSYYQTVFLLYPFVILFGFSLGGADIVWLTILKRCFAKHHFIYVFGIWYFVTLTALMAGSTLTGLIYDWSANYSPSFIVVLAALTLFYAMILSNSPRDHAEKHW